MSDQNIPQTAGDSIEIVLSFISVASAIACITIIIIYLIIYDSKKLYHKFIIALAISDLLYSLCKKYSAFISRLFFTQQDGGTLCNFQGAMQQYGFNASTFVIFCISLCYYLLAIDKGDHLSKYYYVYIGVSMIIPAIVSMWFIFTDKIRKSGLWCFPYMKDNYLQVTILIHGFYLMPMIATLILYFKSKSVMKAKNEINLKPAFWIPLLQLCFLPIIILRQLNYLFGDLFTVIFKDSLETLLVIAGAIACFNGLLNGLAYGFNKETKQEILRKFRRNSELDARLIN